MIIKFISVVIYINNILSLDCLLELLRYVIFINNYEMFTLLLNILILRNIFFFFIKYNLNRKLEL